MTIKQILCRHKAKIVSWEWFAARELTCCNCQKSWLESKHVNLIGGE